MARVQQHARGVLPPGTRIGRFELIRRLAKGGMAEIYLARALGIHGFEKLVVLKLVLAHLAEDRQFVEMFLGEARLAASLDHPNIVHVTDIGEVGGEPFFVMEYVHGQDLRSILRTCSKKGQKLPLAVALTTVAGAAAGLHYVHEKRDPEGRFLGLVHRDISPSNVMLSYEGGVKLVDFGIAKATEFAQATRAGVLKGKVNYMAPEQCDGKPIDRRTDVFALGIMLYETTTGRRLFAGDNDYHVMSRIVRGVYAKPSELSPHYPALLEQIVLRALSKNPDDRYASAQEFLRALEDFAYEERVSLSTFVVADFLRELFGEQPRPTLAEADDDPSPTALHPDAQSVVRRVSALAASEDTGVVSGPGLSATGVVEMPALSPTGVVSGSFGDGNSVRPGTRRLRGPKTAMTSIAPVPEMPLRIGTGVIDKTARIPVPAGPPTHGAPIPGIETVVAPVAPPRVLGTEPAEFADLFPAEVPPPSVRFTEPADSGPIVSRSHSRGKAVAVALALAVVGFGIWRVATHGAGGDSGTATPVTDPVSVSTAVDVAPTNRPTGTAETKIEDARAERRMGPSDAGAVTAETVLSPVSPPLEPPPAQADEVPPMELVTEDPYPLGHGPDTGLDESDAAEQELEDEGDSPRSRSSRKSRRPKRRRAKTSPAPTTKASTPGLDAMYPGGKP